MAMNKKVVFCFCESKLISPDRLKELSVYLKQSGYPFAEISDLCGSTVEQKTETREIILSSEEVLILACYPRAVKGLLRNCEINEDSLKLNYLNFRELNNEQLYKEINNFFDPDCEKGKQILMSKKTDWSSWYPVIDNARCNACGQSADFCLFGVYEKRDGKVVVVNPKGCKNNCPACGRICPQTAIIFPKYEHDGAIAGADEINEIAEQQRQRQDIDTLLGSNIYQALEMRKAKRQSIIRSTAMQQAIAEREKALAEKSGKP